jgi:hypothetical protein
MICCGLLRCQWLYKLGPCSHPKLIRGPNFQQRVARVEAVGFCDRRLCILSLQMTKTELQTALAEAT